MAQRLRVRIRKKKNNKAKGIKIRKSNKKK